MSKENPLWMPRGSVRAILALGIVMSAIALLTIGKLNPETFIMLTSVVTAFYFVSKKE